MCNTLHCNWKYFPLHTSSVSSCIVRTKPEILSGCDKSGFFISVTSIAYAFVGNAIVTTVTNNKSNAIPCYFIFFNIIFLLVIKLSFDIFTKTFALYQARRFSHFQDLLNCKCHLISYRLTSYRSLMGSIIRAAIIIVISKCIFTLLKTIH